MASKSATLVEEDKHVESAVRKGYALATFVKPHFERDKDDKAYVSYEISLPLTEEHRNWVPDEIGEAWEVAADHGYKLTDIEVENQVCEILLTPDGSREGGLKVDTAEIEKAAISTITEKGTGEDREVIRLHFRIRMEVDNDTGRFARVHFGHPVWLKLQPLQRKLIK
jgi:hypothetical protein